MKAASQTVKCILCSGTHAGRRGQVRKYLAACNTFLDMSIPQRWNAVKRHKICVVCLTTDDHGTQGQSCPHKSRLSCKCGSEGNHHKLLCSNNPAHAVSNPEQPDKDDDEKGGGSKKKKSKKKAKKPASQSSLPQVSYENSDSIKQAKKAPVMTIFMDRLLLLVHTLLALSKEAPDLVFRVKCQKHLDDEWFQQPIILSWAQTGLPGKSVCSLL